MPASGPTIVSRSDFVVARLKPGSHSRDTTKYFINTIEYGNSYQSGELRNDTTRHDKAFEQTMFCRCLSELIYFKYTYLHVLVIIFIIYIIYN